MTAEAQMAAIKARLQAQQDAISWSDHDAAVRLTFRAELDALWACVEVLAQMVDGRDDVRVPDYWRASGK